MMTDVVHVPVIIGNTRIFFPFEPYDVQREYMDSVLKALKTSKHALLESPTGTGKTLSLLCSTLAWAQTTGAKSMIYYTSRTHLQLAQVAKEMKRTAYSRVPSVVIGSRAQMCLNDEVRLQRADFLINRSCRNAIAKNACSYHTNYESKLEVLGSDSVFDIEDLSNFGKRHQCCPYYASKKIAETKARMIFMPYNYLLDSSLRKSSQLKLNDSVIIFDEAHNVEGVLKDSVSGSFTLSCLTKVIESSLKLPSKLSEALTRERYRLSRSSYDPKEKDGVVDEFAKKKPKKNEKEPKPNIIEELSEKLTTERLQLVNRCATTLKTTTQSHLNVDETCNVDKVMHVMKLAGVEYSTSDNIITTLDSMASFWSVAGVLNPEFVAKHVTSISNLAQVISLLFPNENLSLTRQTNHEKKLSQCYNAHLKGIYDVTRVVRRGELKDWTLHLWCLSPAIGLKKLIESSCLTGPKSIIMTSGTLAPMNPISKELELQFDVVKSFKHIIGEDQLKILVIGQSASGYSLASHFEALKKDEYSVELGKTLAPLLKILPFGTLVFFQSYGTLNKVIKFWKEKSNTWRDITSASSAFFESKDNPNFVSDMRAFKGKVDLGLKAVFFGVHRGKLSEGINLQGNHCRNLILTGLPFPQLKDPLILATRRYHEKKGDQGGGMWYSQQMTRALNQTVGRVIRSKSDFGMLILCDPRFMGYRYSLSEWTKPYFPSRLTNLEDAEHEIKTFFTHHGINIREKATENIGAFELDVSKQHSKAGSATIVRPTMSSTPRVGCDTQPSTLGTNGAFSRIGSQSAQEPSTNKTQLNTPAAQNVDNNQPSNKATKNIPNALTRPLSSSTPTAPAPSSRRGIGGTNALFARIASQLSSQEPAHRQADDDITIPVEQQDNVNHRSDNNRTSSAARNSLVSVTPTVVRESQPSTGVASARVGSQRSQPGDYSILDQYSDKNRPSNYRCQVCWSPAHNPYRTNCTCARVGCFNCLKVLNQKPCGKCKMILDKTQFKQLLFKSAFSGKERLQLIVARSSKLKK